MTLVVGTDQHTGRSVGLARKLSNYCDLLLINYSHTIIEIEYEKELKVKIFFLHLSHGIMEHHISIGADLT